MSRRAWNFRAAIRATLSLFWTRNGPLLRSLSARARGGSWRDERGAFFLGDVDRLCGQIAIALHNAEFQIYATLALIVVVGVLLFPPKNDPDQA